MSKNKPITGLDLKALRGLAGKDFPRHKKLVGRLKRRTPKNLDDFIHQQHQHQFNKIDCLECANCCKTTPALVEQNDIDRIADHLRISTGNFITRYIEMDEDGDFVFNSTPCPMLGNDNYCRIYDVRPASCSDFPHTTRKAQHKILDLTLENTKVCPAVYRIFQGLEVQYEMDHR